MRARHCGRRDPERVPPHGGAGSRRRWVGAGARTKPVRSQRQICRWWSCWMNTAILSQCRARHGGRGRLIHMSDPSFETALNDRVDAMIDACTRCGKCVEVCPSVQPAGLSLTAESGRGDRRRHRYVRGSEGNDALRAHGPRSCCSAANASRRATTASIRVSCWRWRAPRWRGLETSCRAAARGCAELSAARARDVAVCRACSSTPRAGTAGTGSASVAQPGEPPDFVFYTGCNVLKTPHIALLLST